MAIWRKRTDAVKKTAEPVGPSTDKVAAPVSPAPQPTPTNGAEPGSALLEFDKERSERTLRACAEMFSWAETGILEVTQAASPFLSVSQKARFRALATNFDARPGHSGVAAPAIEQRVHAEVGEGDAASREELERAIDHRVSLAVHDALRELGVSPNLTIAQQVESKVRAALADQEARLLDYVKSQLTESLNMLQRTVGAQLTQTDQAQDRVAVQREVDKQVEEAREAMLKNIDEVRQVDVGFNIEQYAASITSVTDVIPAQAQAEEAVELELGGDEEELIVAVEAEEEEEEAREPGGATEAPEDEPVTIAVAAKAEVVEVELELTGAPEKVSVEEPAAEQGGEVELELDEGGEADPGEPDEEVVLDEEVGVDEELELSKDSDELSEEAAADSGAGTADEAKPEAEVEPEAEAGPVEEAETQVATEASEEADSDASEVSLELDIDLSDEELEADAIAHHIAKGDEFHADGDLRKAIKQYTQALKLDDTQAHIYFKRGRGHLEQGKHRKAFLDLMRAYDLDANIPNLKKYLTEAREQANMNK